MPLVTHHWERGNLTFTDGCRLSYIDAWRAETLTFQKIDSHALCRVDLSTGSATGWVPSPGFGFVALSGYGRKNRWELLCCRASYYRKRFRHCVARQVNGEDTSCAGHVADSESPLVYLDAAPRD